MSRFTTMLPALFAVMAGGCSGYMVRPVPANPVSRVFGAGFEKTWMATLDALKGTPLLSVDRTSGIVVTDWSRGRSDHRYFGTPERVEWWQQARSKMTVRVSPVESGTWVGVDLYEETNFPRRIYSRPSWSGSPFGTHASRFSGHYGHSFEAERLDSFEVDEWVPTQSSTVREKDFLDRIEYALLARG